MLGSVVNADKIRYTYKQENLLNTLILVGTLLTPEEEQTHRWWVRILDNIKSLKKAMLYTNLYRSNLIIVDENTFRYCL